MNDKKFISVNYTPRNRGAEKSDKCDSSESLSPFLASATSFLSKLSDESGKATLTPTSPIEDSAVLFANSIVPDLRKLDDKHFALIKMIITKNIYDVLTQQLDP